MRKRYERYDLGEFARLYYEEELSERLCADIMGIDERNLWDAAKRHGMVLRTHSEAQLLAYRKNRKFPPNPEASIDWELFRHHYYNLGETYAEIAPLLGMSPAGLQTRAVQKSYISRRAVPRPKKTV